MNLSSLHQAHSWLSGEVPAVKREPSSASDFVSNYINCNQITFGHN